jgi:hypothetical protein
VNEGDRFSAPFAAEKNVNVGKSKFELKLSMLLRKRIAENKQRQM